MITTSIPGRLRVRHATLRNPAAAAESRLQLDRLAGVLDARFSTRVGSVLVTYEPARIDASVIVAALKLAAPDGDEVVERHRPRAPLPVLATMGTTLAVLLGALAFGAKHLHALAGVAFVGSVGLHLVEQRMRRARGRAKRKEEAK